MMKRLAFVVSVGLVVCACSTGNDAVVQGSDYQFTSPGGRNEIFYDGADRKQIPDLHGDSLTEPGKELKVSTVADGKPALINLWGSWCPPCRAEAPDLEKMHRSGTPVLGIDVRDPDRQAPQDFVQGNKITYPSIYDPPGRSLLPLRNYPASAVPSTIVVDKQRRVAAVFIRQIQPSDVEPLLKRLASE